MQTLQQKHTGCSQGPRWVTPYACYIRTHVWYSKLPTLHMDSSSCTSQYIVQGPVRLGEGALIFTVLQYFPLYFDFLLLSLLSFSHSVDCSVTRNISLILSLPVGVSFTQTHTNSCLYPLRHCSVQCYRRAIMNHCHILLLQDWHWLSRTALKKLFSLTSVTKPAFESFVLI